MAELRRSTNPRRGRPIWKREVIAGFDASGLFGDPPKSNDRKLPACGRVGLSLSRFLLVFDFGYGASSSNSLLLRLNLIDFIIGKEQLRRQFLSAKAAFFVLSTVNESATMRAIHVASGLSVVAERWSLGTRPGKLSDWKREIMAGFNGAISLGHKVVKTQ